MAKTPEQFEEDIAASIESEDASIDTRTGPIPQLFIRPFSTVFSDLARQAEDMRLLFTSSFAESITTSEVALSLANFGQQASKGARARHIQYFMSFSKPTDDIVIPVGILVGNSDGSFVYRVTQSGTIPSANPSSFFNSARNAYEIGIPVEAVAVGANYNIAAFRVAQILTPLNSIDSTENRSTSNGGRDPESIEQQTSRLKRAMFGLNLGSSGGITSRILNDVASDVTEVISVEPIDEEFVRLSEGAAIDMYVWGQNSNMFQQTFLASAGQTLFPLEKVPALEISKVTVNGTDILNFKLSRDLNRLTGKSLQSRDFCIIDEVLLAGDQLEISYTYNFLLQEVSDSLDDGNLFNTDVLVREPFEVSPVIVCQVRILPRFQENSIRDQIISYFEELFSPTVFLAQISPETTKIGMKGRIAGLRDLSFSVFRRSTGSNADVEVITFSKAEKPSFDSTLIEIIFAG